MTGRTIQNMKPLRGIRLTVNTAVLRQNIQILRRAYADYTYYMAVVKADAYGHGLDRRVTAAMIEGGADYLVVCYLEEAKAVRRNHPDIPILMLNPPTAEELPLCLDQAIDVTVDGAELAEAIAAGAYKGLRAHIKLDTGLGRYGVRSKADFNRVYGLLAASDAVVQGLYTHLTSETDLAAMQRQVELFSEMTADVDLSSIPIIHIPSGEAMLSLPRPDFVNGARVGSVSYGMIDRPELGLHSAFTVSTEVLSVRRVKKGETIGYCGSYTAPEDGFAAMLPIGYAIGFLRGWRNHTVFIGGVEEPLIGGIFMCQCYAACPPGTRPGEEVILFRDFAHIAALATATGTIPEEILLALKPCEVLYI